MKNKVLTLIAAIILFVGVIDVRCYALTDKQSTAIQSFLDEACRISGVPGMALSIHAGDDVTYFASGYADKENLTPVTENTFLHEILSPMARRLPISKNTSTVK